MPGSSEIKQAGIAQESLSTSTDSEYLPLSSSGLDFPAGGTTKMAGGSTKTPGGITSPHSLYSPCTLIHASLLDWSPEFLLA
jgi:hypothetical protein